MIFKATTEQALQIMVNAINASQPMGMGFLHFEMKNYTIEDFVRIYKPEYGTEQFYVDYFAGRMVKFGLETKERININEAFYEVRDDLPRIDYQSWARIYPTYEALVRSVDGVTIV